MKIAILGFGREGQTTLNFARKKFKSAEFQVLDKKFDPNYLKKLAGFDLIFRTPGIPYNLKELRDAREKGAEISSATRLFFDEAGRKNLKTIGITGTKGKGTTSTILYRIIRAAGKKVFLAGNIGRPALAVLPKAAPRSLGILELSSFQLQDLEKSPAIAAVLDIFPDHLDSHLDLAEYLRAKENIGLFQKKNGLIFFFSDNRLSRRIAQKSPGRKIGVALNKSNPYLSLGDIKEIRKQLRIPGEHNLKNAVMAATIASFLKIPKERIFSVIRRFHGNRNRLELVRTIGKIRIYNDSGSTNPETSAAAVKSFSGPRILIAGGKDKNLDYAPLAAALKNSDVFVVLYGESRNKIKKSIEKTGARIKLVPDLTTALNLAWKFFRPEKDRMGTIIFSPGAASFDQFSNYEERGRIFNELVRKLR